MTTFDPTLALWCRASRAVVLEFVLPRLPRTLTSLGGRAILLGVAWLAIGSSSTLHAQRGDRRGEFQRALPDHFKPPPAPALSPEEAMKTIRVAPGFRLELVASEPLVQDPIAMTFDEDGRLFVVEMRGFMPNVDGQGENEPAGRISMLEDADGDGRMDRSTVFVDGLVMPRSAAWTRGGLIYVAGGKLLFAWDTNQDGRADETTEIDPRYSTTISAPEHEPNGLLLALDNWYYNAKASARYRFLGGQWRWEPTEFRGQWGISQDDFGRLYYNVNSSQLHADLVPPNYIGRNSNYETLDGINMRVTTNQRLFTIRMNTGVNRAYQSNVLDARGYLREFTSACAPFVYRGDRYPADMAGNIFVCEPAANVVKRNILTEGDLALSSRFAYEDAEFLASTDERFRPVNLSLGPDGHLYVVDMYRGIIQHRNYVTSHLRREILARELDRHVHLGRIYRVVRAEAGPLRKSAPRRLSTASAGELVDLLGHPSGWWRDTAQRLLVERGGTDAILRLLRTMERTTNGLTRLHALWTLEGLGVSAPDTLRHALEDPHPKVRLAALRVIDSLARRGLDFHASYYASLQNRLEDPSKEIRLQAVYSLGSDTNRNAFPEFLASYQRHGGEKLFRDSVLSGLQGRELEFLGHVIARGGETNVNRLDLLIQSLASATSWERRPERVERLLTLAAEQNGDTAWRARAILAGILENADDFADRRLALVSRPTALDQLLGSPNPEVKTRAERTQRLLTWPGAAARDTAAVAARPLTVAEQAQFERGKELFAVTCAACHGVAGQGLPALAPPLAKSEWITGPPDRPLGIVLAGMEGPITVAGKRYEPPNTLKDMPTLAALQDDQIADVLTYVRREWGHTADPVPLETVTAMRKKLGDRSNPFTEEELLKLK